MGLFTETKRVTLGSQFTDIIKRLDLQIDSVIQLKNQALDLRKTASEDAEFSAEDVAEIDNIISSSQAKISAI